MNSQILDPVGDSPAIAPLLDAITENPAVGRWRRVPEMEALASRVLDGVYIAFEHRDGPLPDAGQLEFAQDILPLPETLRAENG